jgi:hypothetical protein
MSEIDADRAVAILRRIRDQVSAGDFRVTQHAQQEMAAELITLSEVQEAIARGQILEDYPYHRRGPCCLLGGFTNDDRALHIVCTAARPVSIIITVYEPKLPKWVTPAQRRQ